MSPRHNPEDRGFNLLFVLYGCGTSSVLVDEE
jgi:hypothetical protein